MRRVVLAALLATVAACGGKDDSASSAPVVASYYINGATVSCSNPDTSSEYQGGSYHMFSCGWVCATYKGQAGVNVHLEFVWSGGQWNFWKEQVNPGTCN